MSSVNKMENSDKDNIQRKSKSVKLEKIYEVGINPYPNILQFFVPIVHLMFLQIFLFCFYLPLLMLSFYFPFSLSEIFYFFSLFTCFARPNANASSGIFFVITDPAAVSTSFPISTGATIIELLPIKAFLPIFVLCLFFPS